MNVSAKYLTQKIMLGVLMQRGDGACRAKPGIDVSISAVLTQAAVVWHSHVVTQLTHLPDIQDKLI